MLYPNKIEKSTISTLPPCDITGEIIVIDRPEDVAAAIDDLKQCPLIGFDTETRPSFQAGVSHKVSLLQLSTKEHCFLIRLNKLPLSRDIIAILSSKNIMKIGADVRNDIVALNKLRHFTPNGFIDLQNEVGKYGIEDKSLRKISGIVLGKKVSKAQRLSNWAAKQLTPQQQMYAATDAWVCIEIYNRLTK
jgi:ribonuclease D